jgi:hypothetical protein
VHIALRLPIGRRSTVSSMTNHSCGAMSRRSSDRRSVRSVASRAMFAAARAAARSTGARSRARRYSPVFRLASVSHSPRTIGARHKTGLVVVALVVKLQPVARSRSRSSATPTMCGYLGSSGSRSRTIVTHLGALPRLARSRAQRVQRGDARAHRIHRDDDRAAVGKPLEAYRIPVRRPVSSCGAWSPVHRLPALAPYSWPRAGFRANRG